jgi:DNA polymerase alpha subunit A
MSSKRAARLAQLEKLKAARAGGNRDNDYQVEEEVNIYDEVDEEGYKKVVRGRLDQDDFVVDDNGEGYADDGREEDWEDGRRNGYSSEEEDTAPRGKAGIYYIHQRAGIILTCLYSQAKARRRR